MVRRRHRRRSNRYRTAARWLGLLGGAALVLVAVAVAVGQAKSMRRQAAAQDWLQQAAEHESNQQWLQAAQAVEAYLDLQPEAADQRVRLAKLYAAGAQNTEQSEHIIAALYRAVGICREDERLPLQVRLGELLLAAERFSEAETQTHAVIQSDPQNSSALRVRALAQLRRYRRGELDRMLSRNLPIVAWLDEARRANPGDVELAELTAAAYRNLDLGVPGQPSVADREQLADACLDELVEAAPQDPAVYLARYNYRVRLGLAGADADLALALQHGPTAQKTVLTAAAAAQDKAQFAKAVELYRQALAGEQPVSEPEVYLQLGDALLALGNRDEALSTWRGGLKLHPQARVEFNGKLADAYLSVSDWHNAEQCVNEIDAELSVQTASDRDLLCVERDQSLRRGMLLNYQENQPAALAQFRRVITLQEQIGGSSPQTAVAWRHLGESYARSHQWGSAAAAFDYACHEQPQTAELWLLAARAHLQAKRTDLAVDRAEQAVRRDSSPAAHATLASALLAHRASSRNQPFSQGWPSLAAVQELLGRKDDKPQLPFEAAVALSQVQAMRGEHGLAEDLLLRAAPDRSPAERRSIDRELVAHALRRGDVTQAHTLLSQFILDSPGNTALLELAAEVDIDNNRRIREQEFNTFLP
jgi:tetratricopeptide (TPR) repeat protein